MSRATSHADRAADTLREIVVAYVAAQGEGDAKAVLRHFHRSSPTYESTRQMLNQLFLNYKLKCELLGMSVVGTDERYAYVTVRQRTEKVDGPEFHDNVTDTLLVMREDEDEDEGEWKIWSQALLSAELVKPEEAAPDGR